VKKIEPKWAVIEGKGPYLPVVLVISFILLIYLPSLDIYLMGDDFEFLNESYGIRTNPAVMLSKINHFFRPLIKLSFFLEYTFFKTKAPFYNLTNILLHLLNVLLLYILVFRITGKNQVAFLTTLAYGTSPIYSEAILWCSARTDSFPLVFMLGVILFFDKNDRKKIPARYLAIILLTLCALGSKETWMILPFLVLSYLLIVKHKSFKTALRETFPLFLLLALYIAYFIGLPLLSGGASAPTAYATAGAAAAVKKFAFLIFQYMGLSNFFTGAAWQYIPVFLFLTGLGYRFIRTKNRLALWGLTWMLLALSISLPIAFAPARYNYIPLVGFWMMVIAFLSREIEMLMQRFRLDPRTVFLVSGILMILCLTLQVTWLQREIDDYRVRGLPHKRIVDMYQLIKDRLPHDRPIIFQDLSTRRAEHELIGKLKGYEKVLFVRKRAIWGLVFLSPLVNFAGDPFCEILEPIPGQDLESVLLMDFTVLVFSDEGFFISYTSKARFREYYHTYGKLPYKVEALHFVPVK
jgi:hypothetical protein